MARRDRPVSHHECPAPGCELFVPDTTLACRRHWFQLPKVIRDWIWEEYQPGQSAATMTDGYVEALAEARSAWEEHG